MSPQNSVSLWEGDGSFPMEGFTSDASRQPQMVSVPFISQFLRHHVSISYHSGKRFYEKVQHFDYSKDNKCTNITDMQYCMMS